jgi:peptidoglycan/xylan/chitin deacetylase (PgdA/CDA1 family)
VTVVERDLIGYGEHPPAVRWPDGARIAINLVVNYEEGAENRFEDGCARRETMGEALSPVPVDPPQRDLANESMFEYGSRAGVWRLLRLFDRFEVKATFFACAVALERHPAVGRAVTARGHDVLAHGNRWEEHFLLDRDAERAAIERAVGVIEATTGQRPQGWYCRYGPGVHTRELVAASGHFLYDSDAYNDDLPYYVRVHGKPWLVIPYALDTNDIRFWRGGLTSGVDFFEYLRDAFDLLYQEGATHPRLMSVGLHCRIAGRPGRARGLERFLAHARSHPGVWFARRGDIARFWLERHPPGA